MFTIVDFSRCLGLLALVSAASLCSCGEKKEEAPAAAEAPAAQETAAPEQTGTPGMGVEAAREAVYRQLLENISPLVTDRATAPEFNEKAKVYLEALQAYHAELTAAAPTVESVDIGCRMAELTRNLGAYAKAHAAYEHALEDFDALPEADRLSVAGRRLRSALLNGTGQCLMSIDKIADSIPYYEKALEEDIAIMRDLGVAEDSVLPENSPNPEVSRAVADVMGSYRCLGESHLYSGDLEEARDVYKKGIEVMTQLQHLDVNSGMGIAYVKLHAALGDLENRCSNDRTALASWVQAANLCNAILSRSNQLSVKIQAKRFFDTLRPLIEEKARKMQAEAAIQQSAEKAAEAAEAEKVTQEAAAAQAAQEAQAAEEAARAEEAEKAAAAREAETPKEERSQKRRRNRR